MQRHESNKTVMLPFNIYMSKANCLGTVNSKNFNIIRDFVENCSRDTLASITSTEFKTLRYVHTGRQVTVMRLVSLYKAGLSNSAILVCLQRYVYVTASGKTSASDYRQNAAKKIVITTIDGEHLCFLCGNIILTNIN